MMYLDEKLILRDLAERYKAMALSKNQMELRELWRKYCQ